MDKKQTLELKTKKSTYSILSDFGFVVNKEISRDFQEIKKPKTNVEEVTQNLRKELSDEDIKTNLSYCISLGLSVTEACCFRCGYCVYSGQYSHERTHSGKRMSFDTAQKAVDLFFQTIMYKRRTNSACRIYIGFYGGECLMEFDLIKKTIEYAEEAAYKIHLDRRFDLKFRMTTNGYLLDDEAKIEFLAHKDVLLDVSLDGPEEEHDKFRVTAGGGKTWATIMDNMQRLKNRWPEYYDSNVNYLITIHPQHDGKAIDRFFQENHSLLFSQDKVKYNRVNLIGLDAEEIKKIKESAGPTSDTQFQQNCRDLEIKINYNARDTDTRYTSTCFPGGIKIFIDPDGGINVCEKMTHDAPKIGNVTDGFDFHAIRDMVTKYNEEIIRNRCWECPWWFLCTICLAKAFREGGDCRFDCSVVESNIDFLKSCIEKKEEEEETEQALGANEDGELTISEFLDNL
jgi:uncharacterized protein